MIISDPFVAMYNRTSCAQLHELPQSQFSEYIYIYIYIYIKIEYIYIEYNIYTYIYIYKLTKLSHRGTKFCSFSQMFCF